MRLPNAFVVMAAMVAASLTAVGCGGGDDPPPTNPVIPSEVVVPPPPPPPPPTTGGNQPPTVSSISCDPCDVPAGETSNLQVVANDPDGDPLTYRWEVDLGHVNPQDQANAMFTVPEEAQIGLVYPAVTISDGRGGTVTRRVSILVPPPPPPPSVPTGHSAPAGVDSNDWVSIVGSRRSAPAGVVSFSAPTFGSAAKAVLASAEAQAKALSPGITTGSVVVHVRAARPDEKDENGKIQCGEVSAVIACSSPEVEIVFASEELAENYLVVLHEVFHHWKYYHGGDGIMRIPNNPLSVQDRLIFEAASYILDGELIVP